MLHAPSSERQFILYEALRKGASIDTLYEMTKIKHYFLEQMKELVEEEENIRTYAGKQLPDDMLKQAKLDGFSDRYLAGLLQTKSHNKRCKKC